MKNINIKSNIMAYIDSLRVVACILVIAVHTSGVDWETNIVSKVFGYAWGYAVAIFFAISGACYIGKKITNKRLAEKIIVILISYLCWSLFYLFVNETNRLFHLSFCEIIIKIIFGNYHMWYLRMLIFLYCMLPIINEVYKNKKLFNYLCIVVFIYAIVFDQYKQYLTGHGNIMKFLNGLSFSFRPSYLVYFLLGAVIRDSNFICKKYSKIIIPVSIIGLIIGTISRIYGGVFKSRNLFIMALGGADTFCFSGIIYVGSIFALFKCIDSNNLTRKLSKYLYGIYLIHPLVISFLFTSVLKIPTLRTTYIIFDVIINTFFVFILSLFLSIIGNYIPIIGEYVFLHKGEHKIVKKLLDKTKLLN